MSELHQYFPININNVINKYKTDLLEFSLLQSFKDNLLLENSIPISISVNEWFSPYSLIESLFKNEPIADVNSLSEFINKLFYAPDQIVSFDDFEFENLKDFFDQLISSFEKSFTITERDDLIEKLKIIFPIFIRPKMEQVFSETYSKICGLVFRALPGHSLSKALQIMYLSSLILLDLKRVRCNLSKSLSKIFPLIKEIAKDEEISILIFPILLPRITEIVAAACSVAFNLEEHEEPAKLDITFQTCQFFVLVASLYPPSFCTIPWLTLCKYYSRFINGHLSDYPHFEFVIDYPHLTTPSAAAYSVNVLLNSFSIFTSLARENDSGENGGGENGIETESQEKTSTIQRDILYSTLIKMAHGHPAAARAIGRSLICLFRYPLFSYAFNSFKNDIKVEKSLATTLYGQIAAYNFSLDFEVFESEVQFSNYILDNILMNGLNRLVTMDVKNMNTIFDVVRLTDGLMLKDDIKFIVFIHENRFLPFLTSYLDRLMDEMVPIADPKFSLPFIHLATQYIVIRTKLVSSVSSRSYVGFDVEFFLKLYHNIILSAPTMNRKMHFFTTIGGDSLIERRRISEALRPFCTKFFQIATFLVQTKCASLLESTFLLLADILELSSFERGQFEPLIPQMKFFLRRMMRSESIFVFNAVCSVLTKTRELLSEDNWKMLIDVYIEKLEKKHQKVVETEQLRIFTRIVGIFQFLSINPKAKLTLIYHEKSAALWSALTHFLKRSIVTRSKVLALSIIDLLLNIMSPSVTCDRNANFEGRCATEIFSKEIIANFLERICQILNMKSEKKPSKKVQIEAIRLLRFACQNPFILAILKEKNFRLSIEDIVGSKIISNEDFACFFMEFALTVAHIDSEYAKYLIGYDENKYVLRNEEFWYQKVTGILYGVLEGPKTNGYPKMDIEKMQKRYQQQHNVINYKKYNFSPSNPVPPNITNNYMEKIPLEFFHICGKISYEIVD